MPIIIPQDFFRAGGPTDEVVDQLGPLQDLVGTWVGNHGWNLVAVPAAGSTPGQEGQFELLVRPYLETLTFTPVGAPVRNRGGAVDQFVGALQYEQQVTDSENLEVLHVENGMWLYLANIVHDESGLEAISTQFSIGRTASIPHGDAALLLGNSTENPGGPAIPPSNSQPPDVGQAPLGYLDPYSDPDPINRSNLNLQLQQAIAGQNILHTTTLSVDSLNQGAVTNIPFVTTYANTTRFQCTYWIETVQISPTQTIMQLQYNQTIDMLFHEKFGEPGLITWPHVNVNTLVKQ